MPVDTCYRILDLNLAVVSVFTFFGLAMVYVKMGQRVLGLPAYWTVFAFTVLELLALVLKGLPFNVRFGAFFVCLFSNIILVAMTLGVAPHWLIQIVLIVATTSLCYGPFVGAWATAAVLLAHVFVGWGWVTGKLPWNLSHEEALSLTDLRSRNVWVRYLVTSCGLLSAVVLMIKYVLGDMNRALIESKEALRQLAIEQEQRARAEEARLALLHATRDAQKFEALGRLASGVAHDFNNVLCVMKCWSTYLEETTKDPEVVEAMGEVKRATEGAETLTQHLLAFSRSEASRNQSADLCEIVRHEARTLVRLLPRNITVDPSISGSVNVPLSSGQIQEIILNLAINARDAMPSGGRLRIDASRLVLDQPAADMPAGTYGRLIVSDSGIGMDPATVARIFEPFFTTKEDGKGTGLGLAMVFGIISGAHGKISVASSPGAGSTFTVLLPEIEAISAPTEAVAPSAPAVQTCHVVVIDSNPELGRLIVRILRKDGFTASLATEGNDALERVEKEKPALVITQGVLAGQSVADVIERAEKANPLCKALILSASGLDATASAAVQSGRYPVLSKPFEAEQLRAAIREALLKGR